MSEAKARRKKIERIVEERRIAILDNWTQEELAEWAIVTRTNDIRGLLREMYAEALDAEYERVFGVTPEEDEAAAAAAERVKLIEEVTSKRYEVTMRRAAINHKVSCHLTKEEIRNHMSALSTEDLNFELAKLAILEEQEKEND